MIGQLICIKKHSIADRQMICAKADSLADDQECNFFMLYDGLIQNVPLIRFWLCQNCACFGNADCNSGKELIRIF